MVPGAERLIECVGLVIHGLEEKKKDNCAFFMFFPEIKVTYIVTEN